MIVNLTKENFNAETAQGVILVDFWATWCGPCQKQGSILAESENALSALNVKIGKVNVDEQPELAAQFEVSVIPTLLVIRNGEVEKQVTGLHNFVAIKELLDI